MKSRSMVYFLFFVILVALCFSGIYACSKSSDKEPKRGEKQAEESGKEVYLPEELTADSFPTPEGTQSIVIVGDIMTWNSTKKYLEQQGVNYPFLATATLLQSADLTIGNLECPIAVEAETIKARYPYKVPPWTLEGLKWAGFDAVSLANNHLVDCNREGMLETFHYLGQAQLPFFGAGENIEQAKEPGIYPLGNLKVAFCGQIAGETYIHEYFDGIGEKEYRRKHSQMVRRMQAKKNMPGTVIANKNTVVEMVKRAKEQADLVIVYLHWGIRYYRPATDFQREVGQAAIDAGADLVVGHHAHFWQPVEVYKGKPIIYGLGNFAFGSANRQADEGLITRVILRDGKIERVELFPLYIKNADQKVRYQSKIMKGASAVDLLSRLQAESAKLGAEIKIEDGRGVLDL